METKVEQQCELKLYLLQLSPSPSIRFWEEFPQAPWLYGWLEATQDQVGGVENRQRNSKFVPCPRDILSAERMDLAG